MTNSEARARAASRLLQLVGTESPTGHRAGIAACFDLVDTWVSPLFGRIGQRIEADGVEHLLWSAPEPGGVLILGHMDTVWPIGTLEHFPYTENDGRVSGPGSFDMKAGLVAAIGALEQLDDLSGVSLLITGDEETGSLTSRPLIEEVAGRSRAVLICEPSLDGAVKVARRGAGIYRVDVTGHAAHAGLEPEKGANALVELAHQVLRFADIADPERGTTVTPSVSRAGSTVNTVPAQAEVHIDVRALTLAELERVDTEIRRSQPVNPRVSLAISGGINRPPMQRELAQDLYELARDAAQDLGQAPLIAAEVGGGSDGNFTAAIGIPTLDGLGPLGDGAHAPHEWVQLDSLGERSDLIAEVIRRIHGRDSGRDTFHVNPHN